MTRCINGVFVSKVMDLLKNKVGFNKLYFTDP